MADIITLDELLANNHGKALTIDIIKDAYRTARLLPITFYRVQEGTHIFRVRSHRKFNFPKDISYRTEGVEIGRANGAGHSVFYGSMSAPSLDQALLTVCMETSKLMRDQKKGHQTFTVGVWKVKREFEVPMLHNPDPRTWDTQTLQANIGLSNQIAALGPDGDNVVKLIQIVNREFSKRVRTTEPGTNYLMSAAFADLMYEMKFPGLIYPSVETIGAGRNIALLPATVERCLKPDGAQFVQFHRDGEVIDKMYVCQYEMAFGNRIPYGWVKMHPDYAHNRPFIEDPV